MPISRTDAESLRDAIQDLLFYTRHRPISREERQQVGDAWQTIDHLTKTPIPIPGEDADAWTFRFREAAWKAYCYAVAPSGTRPAASLKRIKECQDTLRVLTNFDCIDRDAPASSSPPAATPGQGEGDTVLAAILAKNRAATEHDALAAVNAALPSGAEQWSLDRLRKCDTWKEHFNRCVGDYMDANPDATVKRIAVNVGCAQSTVHGSAAYQGRKDARKTRRKQKREVALKAKERERSRKQKDAMRDFAVACLADFQTDGDNDPELLRRYLLQCHASAPKSIYGLWHQYVQRLRVSDLMNLFRAAQSVIEHTVRDELSPDEEDARYKRRIRNAQRRADNRG